MRVSPDRTLTESLVGTCGPGEQGGGVSRVGPDSGLLWLRRLVSPQQQLQVLVGEQSLQEVQVQVQTADGRPVHRQNLVSGPKS